MEPHTLTRDTLITYRDSNDINKTYTQQSKEETVALVTDQSYSAIEDPEVVGVRPNQIYNWKQRIVDKATRVRLTGEDREELLMLRKKVKKLRIEKKGLKKANAYFAKEMK